MLSHHPSTVYQKWTWLTNAKDENLQAELYSSLVEESDKLETWTYLNSAYSGKFTNTYNAKWIYSSNTQNWGKAEKAIKNILTYSVSVIFLLNLELDVFARGTHIDRTKKHPQKPSCSINISPLNSSNQPNYSQSLNLECLIRQLTRRVPWALGGRNEPASPSVNTHVALCKSSSSCTFTQKTQPNPNRIQHQFHFMHIHDPIGKFLLLHAQTNMQWQRETRNRRACLVGELGIQGPVIVQRVDLGTEAANCGIERLGSVAKRLLFARVFGDEGRSWVLQLLGTLQSFAHFSLQGLQTSRRRRRRGAALLRIISHLSSFACFHCLIRLKATPDFTVCFGGFSILSLQSPQKICV